MESNIQISKKKQTPHSKKPWFSKECEAGKLRNNITHKNSLNNLTSYNHTCRRSEIVTTMSFKTPKRHSTTVLLLSWSEMVSYSKGTAELFKNFWQMQLFSHSMTFPYPQFMTLYPKCPWLYSPPMRSQNHASFQYHKIPDLDDMSAVVKKIYCPELVLIPQRLFQMSYN